MSEIEEKESREEIIDTAVDEEMNRSFLEYAMSVIVARALPDVKDGLKPVHRRIIYSMYSLGVKPGTPYKKCARIVGDVIGKLHPHGDSAVYEALVRMGQSWSMRLELVDGHGNFGSLDDGPAAMRYTESRMSKAALSMIEEIVEDTVDMRANYDGNEVEPVVLPARIPNLIVNGSTGIAVGMATNMAPHNLREVVAGIEALMQNKDMELDELMKYIPGPDFPTGGIVIGKEGIREAYATGRGSFKIRGKAEIGSVTARKSGITVTELPYNVGPEKIIARIKELTNNKKLLGVSDVKDYSDRRSGLKLVIECKSGFNPESVLQELYRMTPLEESFGVNNVALVDNQPQTLGLKALCMHFINHRVNVTRRRCNFRLNKAESRAHILEGLITALNDIDQVVALIRSSKESKTARKKLMQTFKLSEVQAEAILEMTLRRLTSLEVNRLKTELKELHILIKDLKEILGSEKKLNDLVLKELLEIAAMYGTDRRSDLLDKAEEIPATTTLLEKDEPALVCLTQTGLVGRHANEDQTGRTGKDDLLVDQLYTSNHKTVGLVTDKGRFIRLNVYELPKVGEGQKGGKVEEIFALEKNEKPVGLVDCSSGITVSMGTKQGLFKRWVTDDLPIRTDPRPVMTLKGNDKIVGVSSASTKDAEKQHLVAVSNAAQVLVCEAEKVAPKGLSAGGVAGMKLDDGQEVVFFAAINPEEENVVYTSSDRPGFKTTELSQYPLKGRGGKGVRGMMFRKGETELLCAYVGSATVEGVKKNGSKIKLPKAEGKRDGSGTDVSEPITNFVHTKRKHEPKDNK